MCMRVMFLALACLPERNDARNYTTSARADIINNQKIKNEGVELEDGKTEKITTGIDSDAKLENEENQDAPQEIVFRSSYPKICHDAITFLADTSWLVLLGFEHLLYGIPKASSWMWDRLCVARMWLCNLVLHASVRCLDRKTKPKRTRKSQNGNTRNMESRSCGKDENEGLGEDNYTSCEEGQSDDKAQGWVEEEEQDQEEEEKGSEEEEEETEEEIEYRAMVPSRRVRIVFLVYAFLMLVIALMMILVPEQSLAALGWLHARDMMTRWLGLMLFVHVCMCVMAASNKPPNFYVSSSGFAAITCVVSAVSCVMLCAVSVQYAGALAIVMTMMFMFLSVLWATVWGQVYSNANRHADGYKL